MSREKEPAQKPPSEDPKKPPEEAGIKAPLSSVLANARLYGPPEEEIKLLELEKRRLEVASLRQDVGPQPQAASTQENQEARSGQLPTTTTFNHSPDYRSISFAGNDYTLTRNQSLIVEALHEAYLGAAPELGKDLLLQKVESKNVRLRDHFKRSPLWGKLIVPGKRKGTYRLAL